MTTVSSFQIFPYPFMIELMDPGSLEMFILIFQILPSRLMPKSPPTIGVYVTGLQLCNASWDTTRSALMSSPDRSGPVDLLVVHIRPVETKPSNKRTIKYPPYACPVYGHSSEAELDTCNIMTWLELPSLCEPAQWTQQKVFIASSLPDRK